ncbi:MAG TPA: ShlB/FhaC/HecB family hemolysin secretion/activation protein [Burkholderiaceae bacterium]
MRSTTLRLASLLLLTPIARLALAQVQPGAGDLLQQVHPPVVPSTAQPAPSIRLDAARAKDDLSAVKFELRHIRITGNTVVDESTLHALVQDLEGRTVTLGEVSEAVARITRYYQRQGYPFSRALIPAQSIRQGELTVQVLEARYGDVRLSGNKSPVASALMREILAPLKPGAPVADASLDRALLLLSDLPEVSVGATASPGSEPGSTDLDVQAQELPTPHFDFGLDNFGSRYTGRARVSAAGSLFNPLHRGDTLGLALLTSGSGMRYARASYDIVLGGSGTHAGVAYSAMRYHLGEDASALDAHGSAGVSSAWLRYPVLRGRRANVYVTAEFDHKRLRDDIGATGIDNQRHVDSGVLSLSGDLQSWPGDGASGWTLALATGHVGFDNSAAGAADQASARTRGSFTKWNLDASHQQRLTADGALYLAVSVQATDANLDSAEKLSVGGPYSVRAYESGALSGDSGGTATVEWRQGLGALSGGRLQLRGFFDAAHLRINHRTWAAVDNGATIRGAGAGLSWSNASLWTVDAVLASRIGAAPAQAGRTASTRGWIMVSRAI